MSNRSNNQVELNDQEKQQANGGSIAGGGVGDLNIGIGVSLTIGTSSSGTDAQGNSYTYNDSQTISANLGAGSNGDQH